MTIRIDYLCFISAAAVAIAGFVGATNEPPVPQKPLGKEEPILFLTNSIPFEFGTTVLELTNCDYIQIDGYTCITFLWKFEDWEWAILTNAYREQLHHSESNSVQTFFATNAWAKAHPWFSSKLQSDGQKGGR